MGIYELIKVDEVLRDFIHRRAGEIEMEKYVRDTCPSISDDGIRKVLNGVTSIEEVLRVTHRGQ